MSDSTLEDSFTSFENCIPVIICVCLCSLFFVIFRYYADSRPDSEHILTNILLYQYSYVCQIANCFAAILIVTEIFNVKPDNAMSCFLYHARMIFAILGIIYSIMITSVGTIAQLRPSLSFSIQSPLRRIALCIFTIFGCCFAYLVTTVGICGVVEMCPFSNMADCSSIIVVVIGTPVIVAQIGSCGTLLIYSLFGKTSVPNTVKHRKIIHKSTKATVSSDKARNSNFQKSNETKNEVETNGKVFVVGSIPSCTVENSLTNNRRIESKLAWSEPPEEPRQFSSVEHIQLRERHQIHCLKKQRNCQSFIPPRNKAENVLGIQASRSLLIKITTYQVSFLIATAIGLPYVVICGRLPSLCIISVGPVRTLIFTTFIPFFWAVTNRKLRLFAIRKLRMWIWNYP